MLLGLAVLGKSNEPLYLRDCRPPRRGLEASDSDKDSLGLSSMNSQLHWSLPLEDQIVMHAALDSFEEKVDRNASGQMPMVKKQSSSSMPHWVGLLLAQGASAVYGYVTATNIKFFALVESQTDTKEIQAFMKSVHMSYIEYIMNPFFTTKGGIKSTTFDEKICSAAEKLLRQSETMV